MGRAQARPPQSAPAIVHSWLKLLIATSVGFGSVEALTDENIFKVMNRLHDAYLAKRLQKDGVLSKVLGRTKAKSDLYTKMLENRARMKVLYNGIRVGGFLLSYHVADLILSRKLG